MRNQIGSQFIMSLKKSDIKRYYNSLVDDRHLKAATIDSIHMLATMPMSALFTLCDKSGRIAKMK